jgi:hypothetical protein
MRVGPGKCLCWLALVGHTFAAEGPVIRPATIELGTTGTVRFHFEAGAGEPGGFQVETAPGLGANAGWQVQPLAPMTELMPGLYEVELPWRGDGPASFYRVVAWGSTVPQLILNEAMSSNASSFADAEGRFWDWIEIYNPGDEAVDLAGYGLTDDDGQPHRWRFPSVLIQPVGFVVVFASELDLTGPELHANFKLNADGERLRLTAPDGRVVDQLDLPSMDPDQSIGRVPDGGEPWHLYTKSQTTPGAPNTMLSTGPLITPPRFALNANFFPAGTVLSVALERAAPEHVIRYTTDGAAVNAASALYAGPLVVDRTTVVRAAAFAGAESSVGVARTYFIGVEHTLPIVSMASEPGHFAFRDGYLYGLGSRVLSNDGQVLQNFPFSGSHAWQDREVEVTVEFFEPDQRLGFQLNAGLKIFGGWGSRGYPQKSFALFARRKYGQGKIDYRVFPEKNIDAFESLVLRNSGNDNQSTHQTPPRPPITEFGPTRSYGSYFVNSSFTLMRDAMMQRLLRETDLDTQAYRPAVLYLNGEYWGIYNLREKINEHYVIDNHGLAKGEFDLIEGYNSVSAGDNVVNQEMRSFFAIRDLRSEGNFATVADNYIEIDNFIDYHLAVIYFQNFDIGNIKSWRPRVPQGRFRFIVYDQDYGFNLWNPDVYIPAMARDYGDYDNMFSFHTAGTGTGTGWPNEGGRTLLLRKLVANAEFRERFIRRCADLLNGPFREDRVQATIREMAAVIRPEIGRHLERWSWSKIEPLGFGPPHQPEYAPFTQETWERNLEVLDDFARNRPSKLRQDCIEHFQLSGELAEVTVEVVPAGAARVQVNSLVLDTFPWVGVYFRDYPIVLTAIARPGYRFVNWTEPGGTEPRLDGSLSEDQVRFVAQFESIALEPPSAPDVIVTEIQYHPAAAQEGGDWIELHNRGGEAVDLTGWILRDENDDHEFILPEATLAPGDYLVLAEDADRFERAYPVVANVMGDVGFALDNGGDSIRLFDPTGRPQLNLTYEDAPPWPVEADGAGYTLQLIDPTAFSVEPEGWTHSSTLGGTPGDAGR